MRIFAITRSGLFSMTMAVVALWTCIAAERVFRAQAARDQAVLIRQMRELRHSAAPASDRTPLDVPHPKPMAT